MAIAPFKNYDYELVLSDLIADIYYSTISMGSRIILLRKLTELLVRKFLNLGAGEPMNLGDITTHEKNEKFKVTERYKKVDKRLVKDFEKTIDRLRKLGNKYTHTANISNANVDELIIAEDSIWDLFSYLFVQYFLKYSLNLKLVSTEYTFDKKKLIFYFASEDRVDFRDLVKELAAIFRVRIELRQIGVRDYAKMVGDCGSCGKTLCCKSIINKFDSVSIKMAREQGVSVAPSKISGVCGRLKCCMGFENTQYMQVKENYPAIGQSVITSDGKGNVTSMNMLDDLIFVNIEGKGLQKYSLSEIKFNKIEKIEIEKRQVCSYEESN